MEHEGSTSWWKVILGAILGVSLLVGLIIPAINTGRITTSIQQATAFLNAQGYMVLGAGATVNGNLSPTNDNSYNLGEIAKRWATYYGVTGIFSGTVTADRFVSTVAIGTAPLTVSSTTKVTNLNADLLDGKHNTDLLGAQVTYVDRTVIATDANGTTWKDLLDMSVLTKPEQINTFTLTVAGGWAGKAKIRIVDAAGTKIWPMVLTEFVEDTDWSSGLITYLNPPMTVSVTQGYKLQFRSTAAGDGAGKTLAVTSCEVWQRE